MQGKINGETPFKCLKETFCIAGTSSGYTLAYSANKVNWTEWTESTPANEELIVNGVVPYMWFKLVGNVDESVDAIF